MGLFPKNINEFLILQGIPRGPLSDVYIVDPVNGSDSNPGSSFESPLLTVAAAFAKCVTNQHDCVLLLSGATADNPTAAINWNKDYTHLVGLSSDLPGLGQRSRIVGSASVDPVQVITFAGNGCVVKNIQLFNGADADVDSGAAVITGDRCHFKNVFFAGMGHATPGARAGSWSAKLNGASENLFEDCTFGIDTIVRAAANAELMLISSSKNTFRRCLFMSTSETAGKFMVSLDNSAAGINFFEDCLFYNMSVNWAVDLTNAFTIIGSGATYHVVLRGLCQLVGITGWSDVVTRFYVAAPAPHAGAGVSTQPTT